MEKKSGTTQQVPGYNLRLQSFQVTCTSGLTIRRFTVLMPLVEKKFGAMMHQNKISPTLVYSRLLQLPMAMSISGHQTISIVSMPSLDIPSGTIL